MMIKEILKKFIDKSIDGDYSIDIKYDKVKMNHKLLKRKYEEEQYKKYKITKEKYSELI